MRIAVLGSWRESEDESDRRKWGLRDRELFFQATAAIGAELARLGHSLVVGGDDADTADYHAARAAATFAAGQGDSRPRIYVLAPTNRSETFGELRAQFRLMFSDQSVPADSWAPAKVFQVREADAVLIVAGAKASRQAGLTAAVSGKRLVCLGSFRGAAWQLNNLFMQSRGAWGRNLPESDELGVLQNAWDESLLPRVVSLLRADNKPRLLIIHGRSEDRNALKAHLENTLQLPDPIIMADRTTPGEVLPLKFEQLASEVDGAIALGTPDDSGALAFGVTGPPSPEKRARQNVWLEVGWFWGRLGLGRVMILTRGDVAIPSDLYGVESYRYDTDPADRNDEIKAFVQRIAHGSRPSARS